MFLDDNKNTLEMCVVLLYFSISKVAKKGTVQLVQWKFPKQHNKLEGLVILCGVLWEYFIPTWKEPKAKKNSQTQEYVFYGHYPKKFYAKNMQIYLKGLGAGGGKYMTLRYFSTFDCKSWNSWLKTRV